MMFLRPHYQLVKKRINEPRRFIQVLMGPRQVGKTTLAGQLVKDLDVPWLFESADDVPAGNAEWLGQVWEAARLKLRTGPATEFVLVIDEIQKISNWSETVKKYWDEDTRLGNRIKLLLLGSSRLLLKKGLTESLTGRFEIIQLMHWSLSEMAGAFGWNAEKYAWFGGYPGSAPLVDDESRWKRYIRDSIIETSVSKDILMLTRVDKPALMKMLFELGCIYSGRILSYTKILGQLHDAGNTTTLAHYLHLLDTAGLLGGVEKYASGTIRKRSSSPKFQVYNNALLSAQRNEMFDEIILDSGKWGHIVESVAGAHLINCSAAGDYSVYYWRERGEEVDFVLERRGKVVAVEVKSGHSGFTRRGMNTFCSRFNPDRIYAIDNKSLSWQEFLEIDPIELF
jgi:uncharacterized protein